MGDASDRPSYVLRRPGGDIDKSRLFNVPGVVLGLAGLTVFFFAVIAFWPERAIRVIEYGAGVSPRRLLMGPERNGGWLGMISPLFAHMFVHASLAHLLFNMLWLLAFGTPVARRMKAEGALQSLSAFSAAGLFLTFYFLSGAVGALVFVAFHAHEFTMLVGASGGVSGLLGGLVRFAFNRSTLFGPEHAAVSALTSPSVLMWSGVVIVMNVAVGIFGGALAGGASIAWEAHIGGYLFGLLTYPLFDRLARAVR